jgi:hypothetical protein
LNPRHERVQTQREAIHAVIENQGQKLLNLMGDIAKNGMSPIDRMMVIKSGRNYIAVEGNRRLAAIKLLLNPELADGTVITADVKKLAAKAPKIDAVDCAIASSRDEARPWQLLRHAGEMEGVGTVRWTGLAGSRFAQRPGSQTAKAINFIDAIHAAYPNNTTIQEFLEEIGNQRLTTLGRVVADPYFKERFGFRDEGDQLTSHYPAEALEAGLEKLLGDIATHLTVTNLKTKLQRTDYLDSIPEPDGKRYEQDARPLKPVTTSGSAKPKAPRRRKTKPETPFKKIDLPNLGGRIEAILLELRLLDLERFPNAAAVMTRALLELSVDEIHERKGWPKHGKELKTKVRRCLLALDSTGKDPTYQAVRAGLQDGTSLFSVTTLHGYVHNQHFHATASEVRTIAANYAPFLNALDGLA